MSKNNQTSFKIGHQSYALKEEIGNIYGYLTVISREENTKFGIARWKCSCKCGNIVIRNASSIRKKGTPSCGCFRLEKRSGEAPIKKMYSSYKIGAKKRSLEFNISYDEFKDIIFKNCCYCNDPPRDLHSGGYRTKLRKENNKDKLAFNGIDRINSKKGYIKDNIVPCCTFCNRAKSNNSIEYFEDKIKKIYNNINKINEKISISTNN